MSQQPPRLHRSRALAALVLAAAGVMAVLAVRTGHRARASEYQAFESPDGRFRVVVYSFPSPAPMMPGQGGDARGFVRLYDLSGRLLREE